jgi:hypothetical protein
MQFFHTQDTLAINNALILIENDYPDRVLHEWTNDIEWKDVHFNLCFVGDEYVGYYCLLYDDNEYFMHIGLMDNVKSKRVLFNAWKHIQEQLANWYEAESINCILYDDTLIRIASRIGFKEVGDDRYQYIIKSVDSE